MFSNSNKNNSINKSLDISGIFMKFLNKIYINFRCAKYKWEITINFISVNDKRFIILSQWIKKGFIIKGWRKYEKVIINFIIGNVLNCQLILIITISIKLKEFNY